jgi:hypothetical protein
MKNPMKEYVERTSPKNKKKALLFLLLSSGLPTLISVIPNLDPQWGQFLMAAVSLIFGIISIVYMGKPLNELSNQEEINV